LITGNAHIEVLAPLGGGVELNGGSDSLGFCFKTTRFYHGADFLIMAFVLILLFCAEAVEHRLLRWHYRGSKATPA